MSCLWHVFFRVYGMFGGLNQEGISVGEKELFSGQFQIKIACTREATGSLARYCLQFGAISWSLHAIAWKPLYCMAGLRNFSSRVRYSVALHTFKPLTLNSHIFLV